MPVPGSVGMGIVCMMREAVVGENGGNGWMNGETDI